jgi:sugar fermentation stimulation protein A
VRLPEPLRRGVVTRREKRFLSWGALEDGRAVEAHCPNPGAMTSCWAPGGEAIFTEHDDPRRKLRFTWQAARVGGAWVVVNTQLPNRLVEEALLGEGVPGLDGARHLRREVVSPVGEGRFDHLIELGGEPVFVEVKGASWLAEPGVCAFPDAKTERGTRHLHTLTQLAQAGHKALILFVICRDDARAVRPAREVDPRFADALLRARDAGVGLLALRTALKAEACVWEIVGEGAVIL